MRQYSMVPLREKRAAAIWLPGRGQKPTAIECCFGLHCVSGERAREVSGVATGGTCYSNELIVDIVLLLLTVYATYSPPKQCALETTQRACHRELDAHAAIRHWIARK